MSLTFFPPLDPITRNYALTCLKMGEQPKMHDPEQYGFVTRKRLTSAELACEYHQQDAACLREDTERNREILETLTRFVAQPEYDQLEVK